MLVVFCQTRGVVGGGVEGMVGLVRLVGFMVVIVKVGVFGSAGCDGCGDCRDGPYVWVVLFVRGVGVPERWWALCG